MKCHSKRLDSSGAACKEGSGWLESSAASFRMRFMVGDLVLNIGSAIILVMGIRAKVRERKFGNIEGVAIRCNTLRTSTLTWHSSLRHGSNQPPNANPWILYHLMKGSRYLIHE